MPGRLIQATTILRQDVNKQEQPNPNHINKVPVPRCRFKTKLIIMAKVALKTSYPLY